jgi:Fic family protein
MTKGIQGTTAIEGNTLSLEEIEKIIQGEHVHISKSKEYQKQEIENVLEVYNNLVNSIKETNSCDISIEQIKEDNRIILQRLRCEEGVIPGNIRSHSVHVGNYRGAPAENCEYLLQRLCEWINSDWGFDEENKIIEAILKAIVGHLYIAWIHPFGDGNGRTARAFELRLLMNEGVPNIAAHILSNFYNETRSEYYAKLGESTRDPEGNPSSFISYAAQGLADGLDEQIKIILEEQLHVIWINYIYNKFPGKLTQSEYRKRDLLLEISEFKSSMSREELRMKLSMKLLELYKDKSNNTYNRDIKGLLKNNFIKEESGKIFANKGQLHGFLPVSKKQPTA